MKILALDTATEACSVAVLVEDEIRADYRLEVRQHAKLILPMVEKLLAQADISLPQLDVIAWGQGPGSFTGLRIAASVTQGLALAHDLPVIGISSLQTLAQALYQEHGAQKVMCALDARMHEVYWGCYELKSGWMELSGSEMVIDPANLLPPVGEDWLGIGSGWDNYYDLLQAKFKLPAEKIILECYPQAEYMLEIAKKYFNEGRMVAATEVIPVYLRNQVTS